MVSEDHLLLPNFPCQSKSLPDKELETVKDRKFLILSVMLDQVPLRLNTVMVMSVSRQFDLVATISI
jgi:hypothetical protein